MIAIFIAPTELIGIVKLKLIIRHSDFGSGKNGDQGASCRTEKIVLHLNRAMIEESVPKRLQFREYGQWFLRWAIIIIIAIVKQIILNDSLFDRPGFIPETMIAGYEHTSAR